MAQATSEVAPSTRPRPRYGCPPRLQQEPSARHAARGPRYEQVKTRFAQGHSLRPIAAACGLNTTTVRSWLRSEALPREQRGYRGPSKIDAYIPHRQMRLAEGCTHQSRLGRESREQGFTGTRSLVAQWLHPPWLGPSRDAPTSSACAASGPAPRLAAMPGRREAVCSSPSTGGTAPAAP
jgi:hypothetical protein